MKRAAVVLALLFTFVLAPRLNGFRSTPSMLAVATVQDSDDPLEELIRKLSEPDEPTKPSVKRPHLAAGEHFVPLLRFTDVAVNEKTVAAISSLIDQANAAGAEAIVLELATPGGVVMEGQELGRAIERSRAPIHCVVDGEAASMGYYVLQSCKTRMMTKRSALMVHEPSVSATISGQQSRFHNVQNALHATSEAMLEHETKRMSCGKDFARKKIENGQDWWMNYGEAKEVGAVDGVVGSVEQTQAAYQHKLQHPLFL